ncbi:MAG: hypothetical protein ABSB61_04135 [Anaerolineales bacterium]|jgi:hypothetical protein
MSPSGRTFEGYAYHPELGPDGALVSTMGGDRIPLKSPDWEEALGLLRRINTLRDAEGRRASSLVQIDGFEPWWFVQDRLYRFYLLPLTQFRGFLQASYGRAQVGLAGAPRDLVRLTRLLSGREGFPTYWLRDRMGIRPRSLDKVRWKERVAGVAPFAFTWASLLLFRLLGQDTLLYIIDQVSPGLDHDFRLSPLYRELQARGYRVAEYAHTLSARTAVSNSLKRRRPVAFIESLGALSDVEKQLGPVARSFPSGATPLDFEAAWEHVLAVQVLAWCQQSATRYHHICQAIRLHGPKRAIIFDDNRHNYELVAACRQMGVKVLGFQHGVFNRFHTGLMAYGLTEARRHDFDLYGLWGPIFAERLTRDSQLFDRGRLFVAGPLRPPLALDEPNRDVNSEADRIRQVLLVSEPLARKHELAPFLRPLLEDAHYHLQIKLRPGEPKEEAREYGIDLGEIDIVQSASVYDAIKTADVVMGTYSSVLYEAALALRPIVWLRTSMAYGAELVQEGLAEEAADPEKIRKAVDRAACLPEEELRRRRGLIWGSPSRSGVEVLLNRAEEELWDPPGKKRTG